jgi:ADP-dependent NAD(P)H-hydrate dehydratase / NAD(P)H-hydrate epimerase
MYVVTAEEMREMDRLTIERHSVPSLVLMERAGAAAARALTRHFAREAKRGVLVVSGKGNNGGDGFVIARHLKAKKIPCEVVLLGRGEEVSRDAGENLRAFRKRRGRVIEADGSVAPLRERLEGKGVLVDAILGTGLKEDVRGIYAQAIDMMNDSGLPIVAVDLPSGLDSDRGKPLGSAIKAALTVALGFPKVGEVIYPGLSYVGELVVADIGIDAEAAREVKPQTELIEEADIRPLVPERDPDTHKGTYGHVLVWAGSRGKTGAAVLGCRAAMRVGAGLVTLAAPRSLNDIFAASMVEVMTEPLRDDAEGNPEPPSDAEWRALLANKDAFLFGPGIGVNDTGRSALRWLLRNLDVPWVIDADGLNVLAGEIERLSSARRPPVLTPHPGEMARLVGASAGAVNRDRVGAARAFAAEHRCYLVLKGARTVIATPEGRVFINPTGNPGMASGGMGDVLAGMLAGLLGQGFDIPEALKLGVYLHGFVGDRVALANGQVGIIASDVLEGLPRGLKQLGEGNKQRRS